MAKKGRKKHSHTTKRKPGRKHIRHKGLHGLAVSHEKAGEAAKHTGIQLLCLLGGGIAGAAIGKNSLLAGIPVVFLGNYKHHAYLTSLGLGMCLANGFQNPNAGATTPNMSGIDGLDPKAMIAGAKDRVLVFFHNFADKLYVHPSTLSIPPPQSLKGLGDTDQANYFLNPYLEQVGAIDLSALDRVQEQVALLATNNQDSTMQGAYDDEDLRGIVGDISDGDYNF